MLKKLVLSCLIGASVLSSAAAEGTVTYSYANDEFHSWGKGKSEIYDIAIRISDPALVGKKITSIRAVLNACEGLESTSLWLSRELVLEKIDGVKVTVPDTYSAEVTPEPISITGMEGDAFGQLSVALDVPYELTEDGIYVGYSLTVPAAEQGAALSESQKYPVMLSPSRNPESLYLRASKDFLKWISYNDKLNAAAAIYVTLEGDFAEYSVGVQNLANAYATADEDFTVRASLLNIGGAPVSKLGYRYSIAGKSFDRVLELDPPFEPDLVNAKEVGLPIEGISELGEYTLDLTLTTVNGGDNANLAASASSKVSVLPFVPVHRPMLEEFTGTWCGWCTRGYYALETLDKLYGDAVVLAAYHDSDPMAVSAYPVYVSGYPLATLNRDGTEDPYYGKSNDGFGMKTEVKDLMESIAIADISLEALWTDDSKTGISVRSVSTFLESKEDAGYKVGYLLINNGLSGTDTSWYQSNYFPSYASDYVGTDLQVLTTWPAKVPGLVFNDVVVDVTGMAGIHGSLPDSVAFNVPYENEFAFDIASNGIIQDKDQLYVAAFIINPDGTILNANKVKVGDPSFVGSLESAVGEVSAEYYSLSGVRVSAPRQGVFVKVSKMSDGSVRTSKMIVND